MSVRPVTGRRRHVLSGLVTAAATLAASGVLLGLSPAAHATGADNGTVLAHLNALRVSHGLRPLVESSDLMSIAAAHSAAMSRSGTIYHNPDLTTEVANWEVVGENVGMGPSAAAIDTAFDHSPEHYANEISSAYTQVGIGTASDSRGYLYITVDFRKPLYASTPAPAPKKAAPKPPTHVVSPVTVLTHTGSATEATAGRRAASARLAAAREAAARAAAAQQAAAAAQRDRVAAVRASAAGEAAGSSSDPLGRALSFSRTLTALAG